MFKTLSTYSCRKDIYKMQHLEGSGTPVLYIGRRFLKVNKTARELGQCSHYIVQAVGSNPGSGKEVFLLSETSRPALGFTRPPVRWVVRGSCPEQRRLRGEADQLHLVPRLKVSGAIPLLPLHVFMAWTRTAVPLLNYANIDTVFKKPACASVVLEGQTQRDCMTSFVLVGDGRRVGWICGLHLRDRRQRKWAYLNRLADYTAS